MKGRLGTGRYEAYVLSRGGRQIVGVCDWSQIEFDRRLDDTSEARVTIDNENLGSVAGVVPWRHELGIFRDEQQVWVGPVINPNESTSSDHEVFQLVARDLSAWLDHRRLRKDHDHSAVDLSTIFQALVEDAMAADNSPGLMVSVTPCGVTGAFQALRTQHLIAGQVIRDISNIGIDWTMLERTMFAGGTTVPAKPLGLLTIEHFAQPPNPSLDGTAKANNWIVRNSDGGTAGDTVFAEAADDEATRRDGLLESVDTVSTIQTYEAALAASKSRLALTSDVKTIQNCQFSPEAPVEFAQLIPGAVAEIEVPDTDIPVSDEFRLQRIDVTVGQDGFDQIKPSFQPVGTT